MPRQQRAPVEDSDSERRGPFSRRGREIREGLLTKSIDRQVLRALDQTFCIGFQCFTLYDAIDNADFNAANGVPGYIIVETAEAAAVERNLTLRQKRALYTLLGWWFECISCKMYKSAMDFEGTSYMLWSSGDPVRPYLRSGPCTACHARRSRGGQSSRRR
ncbi:hypothetical protein M440DRAFT_1463661 [Trichoderma longibrachiatum ATCC 18648]|uniref:Uncharacterized protein n=1 Tax=Trichoderma longibrachiatum ATCC 18648 TaxID=983965 RepID=A0A2T4C0S0_TRILO|nr:hypothetical protein M440DRAFT_1463661 [Trichoderma longibrachiatum ATCC 18648]